MNTEAESTERAPRRRRRWLWAFLVPTLALMALLGTGTGNELLWRLASARIEASSGWRVELSTPRLGWGVVVAARSIEVITPDGRRLATADNLRARLRPGSLARVRSGLRVERLRIDGLWIDPAALPASEEQATAEASAYPVEIVEVDLREVTLATQVIDPPVEIPLGASGAELSQWSAAGWTVEGSIALAEQLRYRLRGDGEVDWRGAGLAPSSLAVEVGLDGQNEGLLRVEHLRARGAGVDADLEGEVGFPEDAEDLAEAPLRLAGRFEVEPLRLLDEEQSFEVAADSASMSWSGDLEARTRLGQFRAEVQGVPLRWAWSPENPSPVPASSVGSDGSGTRAASLAVEELGRLASTLVVDASIDYRARRTATDELEIEVVASALGEREGRIGEALLEVDLSARDGRLDGDGRVDFASLRWAGTARARGAETMDLARLLPRAVREAVGDSGLGERPFELALEMTEVTTTRSRGVARLAVGAPCVVPASALAPPDVEPARSATSAISGAGSDGALCPRLELRADAVDVAFVDGSWNPSDVSASLEGSFTDIRGRPLRRLLADAPEALWQQWIRGEDRVAGTARADLRDGRIDLGAARAEIEWSSGDEVADSLLRFSATARAPLDGEAIRLALEAHLLNQEPGTRTLRGEVALPDGLELVGATSDGALEIHEGLSLLLDSATPFLEDPSAVTRLAAAVRAGDSAFGADVSWSGRLSRPRLAVRSTLRAGASQEPWAEAEYDAGTLPLGVPASVRLSLRLDDAGEDAQAGAAVRSLLAAWADVENAAEAFPWFPSEGALGLELHARWASDGTSGPVWIPGGMADVAGRLEVEGEWLRLGGRWLERVELVLAQEEQGPLIVERGLLRGPFSSVSTSGTLTWMDERRAAAQSLQLEVSGNATRYGLQQFEGTLEMDRRQVSLVASRLATEGGDGRGRLQAPLASLALVEALRGYVQALGVTGEPGPVRLELALPLLRITDRNQADLEFGPLPATLETNAFAFEDLQLEAAIPLDDLQGATATLSAGSGRLAYRGYDVKSREALRASLRNGVIRLEPLHFEPSSPFSATAALRAGEQLVIGGRAVLAAGDVDELLRVDPFQQLQVDMVGPVELALLQEFMAPARVDGLADLEVELRGRPGALSGEVRAQGRGAAIRLLDPYVTELTDLSLAARLEEGTFFIDELAGQLNRGRVRVEGTVDQVTARLVAELEQVRYRVDYGLSTEISGRLNLDLPMAGAPAEERGLLKGRVDIERGTVRRELDLDRELRTLLFAPAARPGDVDPYAERIALDLNVVTSRGIRIRNNVADARASWDELRVRGTLAAPLVEGVVEADPGGLVTTYGQTFRVDLGEARFLGQPGVAPEIVLETTSSLEDPTIRRADGTELDPFSTSFGSTSATTATTRGEAFAGGLADYFGNELAAGIGQGLTRVFGGAFNVRPVLVFGETEPSARLIVTREVDENIDIGVSVELRNPEDRLYLVDLHDFAVAPSLSAQVFTNESGNEGVTLQQNLDLGGSESSPFLVGQIEFRFDGVGQAAEARISERRLRRNLSVRSGERWLDGMDFDAEIDVVDSLRASGFPSPEVEVEVEKRGRRRDLLVNVRPGTPAEIRFEGIEPAGLFRDAIRRTYRNDFFRQAAMGEMERQTRRALEAQGWTEVRATVTVQPARDGDGADQVTVTASSPRRLPMDRLSLAGVGREAALAVESVLAGRGAKIALLEGDEVLRERVLEALAALGWTDARILRVDRDREGRALVLDFDLRLRARIAGLNLVGFDEASEEGLALQGEVAQGIVLQPGDPVIQREIAAAAISVESTLRDRGYIDARVRTEVLESLSGPLVDPFVQLAVDLGVQSRIAEITVPEDGRASPNWLREFLEVEPGALVDRSKLRSTRRRILGTGVFSSVRFETLRTEGPPRPDAGGKDDVTVALRTVERPRWKLAYGTRWESEEGFGVVVDGLDRNLLGRGLQLGARALWTERRQAARGLLGVPDMFGSKLSFESFFELRERDVDGLETSTEEATFQLAYPLRPTLSGRVYLRLRSEEERDLELDTAAVRTKSPVVGTQFIYDGRSDSASGRDDLIVGSSLQANALLRGLEGSLGTFASLDLSQSADFLNNDFDYLRAFAQVFHSRHAFVVGSRRVVWAQSWRLGVIENSGPELPLDQRFFAGGEYSVRGYGRESLGPQEILDDGTRALGGEALFVVNQELRFPVAGDFEGVVLIDSGNVWDDADDLFDEFLSSAGLGVRYRSPLGLLRLDVAVPLDRREGDDSVQFYLGFGHVF